MSVSAACVLRAHAIRAAARVMETELPPPSYATLDARVELSGSHCTRPFTAQVGRGPHADADDLRVRSAAGRLRYTDSPSAGIARDFG